MSTRRRIAWSGLEISTPNSWEAIPKGAKHLLFEKELCPIVEIRWEERTQVDDFYKELSKKIGFAEHLKRLPLAFQSLAERYHVYAYHKKEQIRGLFCYCATCQSLVHIHIHDTRLLSEISQVLLATTCHRDSENEFWSVQDFQFTLPSEKSSWVLDTYSFGAGATRISLLCDKKRLSLYRIAGATTHLHNNSLQDILKGFSKQPNDEIHSESWGYWLEKTPSLWQQSLCRLRKEKPFYHSRVEHQQKSNRILGMSMEGIRPLSTTLIDEIWNSYEILR